MAGRQLPNDGPPASRVLQRNAATPPLVVRPNSDWDLDPQKLAMMIRMMGEDFLSIFLFNKNSQDGTRLCPACMTKYKAVAEDQAFTRAEKEQLLSGICSSKCFMDLNGPDGYDIDEWLGQHADQGVLELNEEGDVVTAVHVRNVPPEQ